MNGDLTSGTAANPNEDIGKADLPAGMVLAAWSWRLEGLITVGEHEMGHASLGNPASTTRGVRSVSVSRRNENVMRKRATKDVTSSTN